MFYSNDRHVIAELIEKLFGKIKKIDSATKLLKKSIKTFVNDFIFEFNNSEVIKLLSYF